MRVWSSRAARWSGTIVIAALQMLLVYGFADSNAVAGTKAGDGANSVSGYAVTEVHYDLDPADPGRVETVSFTLDAPPPPGATVKTAVDGQWHDCSASGTAVSCPVTGVAVGSSGNLRVVVAD